MLSNRRERTGTYVEAGSKKVRGQCRGRVKWKKGKPKLHTREKKENRTSLTRKYHRFLPKSAKKGKIRPHDVDRVRRKICRGKKIQVEQRAMIHHSQESPVRRRIGNKIERDKSAGKSFLIREEKMVGSLRLPRFQSMVKVHPKPVSGYAILAWV